MSRKEDKELALENAKNAVNNKKKSGTASIGDYGSRALNKPSLTERAVDSLKDPVGTAGALKDQYEGGMSAAAREIVGAIKDPAGTAGALKDKFVGGLSAAGDMVSGLMNSESDTPKSDTPAPAIEEEEESQPQSQSQSQSQLSTRQDIASDLEDLSRRGALTGDLLKEARERSKAAGVSDEQFNTFMEKNRIQPSNFATAPKSSSPEEAAQNVMFEMEHGSALKAKAIKDNDPNYKEYVKKHGGVGIADQPPRPVGPESGKLFNMARRMKRAGNPYWRQAHYAAETMRLKEPRIDTPELRRQRMLQKIETGKQASAHHDRVKKILDRLGQSGSGGIGGSGGSGGMQTSEFRDVNRNGIEDRSEGIYRKGEYYDSSQDSITKRVIDSMRSFGVKPA